MRVGRGFSARSNNDFSPDGLEPAGWSSGLTAAELAVEPPSAESRVGKRRVAAGEPDLGEVTALD